MPFSEIVVSGKNIFYGQLVVGMVGTTTGIIDSTSPGTTRYLSTTNLIPVKPNTQYTAQNAENKTLDAVVYYDENESLIGNTYIGNAGLNSFTTPDNCKFVRWRYLFDSVQSDTSGLTNIQLEVGDTATEYELPIIGQEITLTTCGKNLIPYPYHMPSGININGITYVINDDGSITANGTATERSDFYVKVDLPIKKGLYTLSGCPYGGKIENTTYYVIQGYGDTLYTTGNGILDTGNAAEINATEDFIIKRIMIRILKGTVCDNLVFYPQIEVGNSATDYELYNGSTTTITPDSNPYTVPNDIRQQDDINNVSVSAGEVSVTGVKKSPVINRAWEELDSHTNNTTVHVTAEEKAAWNGKFDYIGVVHDLFAVNKTCVCAYDMNTLNTPFSSGLTLSGAGLCFVNYVAGAEYATYLVISSGDTNHYAATSNNGSEHVKWHKISDGGNADALDGKHASDFYQRANGLRKSITHDDAIDIFSNITPNHVAWNSFTDVETNVSQAAIENAPETTSPSRYHVWTYGESMKRGHQIAVSLFSRKVYIRYLKDSAWSDWKNIADGGNADTLDGLHASDIQIDSVSDTAESVTLDNLQGGVPFSEIVLNGDIVGQDVTLTACGKNLADLSGVDGKLISGISFAYDNGNVVLNGTATAQIYLGIKIHLSAGTYTVSGSTNKNARLVLRDKSYRNIADSASPVATVTVVSDDYYVHIAIAAGTVCDNAVIKPQLERGAVATEYEPYSGSTITITPDSNPYTVPNDIRQQDGINNVSVSAGEVSVTGVKRNADVKKIWDNKADLSDIQIDTVSDAAGIVTLNGLQGGVPFSGIMLSGNIVGQEITLRAGGENLLTFNSHNETETISGVTFVRLPDGTITANGTTTDIVQYLSDTVEMSDGNTYTLTGCPAGGSGEGYSITNQATANITDMGSGKTFTYDAATFGVARFKIRIAAGYTCDNVVFRPVLCSGSAVITKITPNSAPYIVTDDIRQQDGINTISVSAGNVTVTGVRKSRAVKRIWDKLDELTAAIIVSSGETE